MRFFEELAHVLPERDPDVPGDTWKVVDYPEAKHYIEALATVRRNKSRLMAPFPEHKTFGEFLDVVMSPAWLAADPAFVLRFREGRPLVCSVWSRVESRIAMLLWQIGFPRQINAASRDTFRRALWDIGIRVMRTTADHLEQEEFAKSLGYKPTGGTLHQRYPPFGWVILPILEYDLLHRP